MILIMSSLNKAWNTTSALVPHHEKTYNVVSEQVRQVKILDLESRGIVLIM